MRKQREDAARTRRNLLAAAGAVFAEKGYGDATVAEICRRAGANIAAVNYHFTSKEHLYAEAWRHAFVESIRAHDPDGGVGPDAPAEERLRGQIVALLERVGDEENVEFAIMQKELAHPTGLLREIQHDLLEPLRLKTEATVREVLGRGAPERTVRFSVMSIISQCIGPVAGARGRAGGRRRPPLGPDDLAAYADHVVAFSLGGLAALRRGAAVNRARFRSSKTGSAGRGTRGKGGRSE